MRSLRYLLVFILLSRNNSCGFPLTAADNSRTSSQTLTDAMIYLMRYGYMDGQHDKASAPLLSTDGLREYIRDLQTFAGLPRTGELDEATAELMKLPRCGVKDVVHDDSATTRRKRYALQGSRWRVENITYKISKYPRLGKMTKQDIDSEIRGAWEVWSSVTNLRFEQKRSGKVHVEIRFEDGEHGDGDSFDGVGGTLAHAFFPVYGGDVHFDNSEHWTRRSLSGTNLLQTAAHEFGHSLGLSHSTEYQALMAPFYRGYQTEVSLAEDDVTAVQALYGKKQEVQKTEIGTRIAGTPPPPPSDDLCQNSTIDSIITMADGTYAFRGEKYWKLTEDALAPGYPKRIAEHWEGLPDRIDASFTWTNGKSYFFKDERYWRFSNGKKDSGYPRMISRGFDGIPDFVDAAFVWSGNGKIYFFKGTNYWRFDPEKRPPVSEGYPRPISNWEGVPDHVDDAVQYDNGFTYFFKGGEYFRFNDRYFRVDDGDPPFPRPAGYWWFGCDQHSRPLVKDNSKVNFNQVGELHEEYADNDDTLANFVDGEHMLDILEDFS